MRTSEDLCCERAGYACFNLVEEFCGGQMANYSGGMCIPLEVNKSIVHPEDRCIYLEHGVICACVYLYVYVYVCIHIYACIHSSRLSSTQKNMPSEMAR